MSTPSPSPLPSVPGFTPTNIATGLTVARGVSTDATGNVYTMGRDNGIITKISPSGVSTVVANLPGLLNGYIGPVFDRSSGNLFVAKYSNGNGTDVLKVVPSTGVSSVFATGIPAPSAITSDAAGNLYVGGYNNGQIYKVNSSGVVTPFANGIGTPDGMVVGPGGDLFVGDRGQNRIMRVPAAGGTAAVFVPSNPVLAIPLGVTVDSQGNLYVANYTTGDISKVSPAGVISPFGSGFSNPVGLVFDPSGNLFVASIASITKIPPVGPALQSQTINFGALSNKTLGDAPFTVSATASSGLPVSFAVTGPATISGSTVTITGVGTVTVTASQAGNGNYLAASSVQTFMVNSTSPLPTVQNFTVPGFGVTAFAPCAVNRRGITTDPAGNVYIMGKDDGVINKISPAGVATQLTKLPDLVNGYIGPVYDRASGNLFVAKYDNNNGTDVLKIPTTGPSAGVSSKLNNTAIHAPSGLTSDAAGNVYVGSYDSGQIYKVTPNGDVSTFATGVGNTDGMVFGPGGDLFVGNRSVSQIMRVPAAGGVATVFVPSNPAVGVPLGIAADGQGNLYVANYSDGTISKVSPAGVVSTLGNGYRGLVGLAFDGSGNLFVANSGAAPIIKIAAVAPPLQSQTITFGALSNKIISDAPFTVSATASSGLPVSLAVTGPAAINGNTVTITGLGTVTVTASQAGNGNYLAAPNVSQTFTVTDGYTLPLVPGFNVTAFSPGNTNARGVSTDAAGNVYTIGRDDGIIRKISPAGLATVVATLDRMVNAYIGPVFDPVSGNLFVIRHWNGAGTEVLKITSAGVVSVFVSGIAVPSGITSDAAGNLYVGSFYTGQIFKVTPAGVVRPFASGVGTPDGMVFGPGGDLFVGDRSQSRIMRIPAAGGAAGVLAATVFASNSAFAVPMGLAADNQGNLYVANYTYIGPVSKVSSAGVVSSFSGFSWPTGVAFDPSGNLFVSSLSGTIVKIAR